MWYLATWNKCFIGISDSKKNLEIYVRKIRELSEEECQIEPMSDTNVEMFYEEFEAEGLFMVEYDGVFLPRVIIDIVTFDLRKWVVNSSLLANELITLTKILVDSKTITDEEEINSLIEAIGIVSKIAAGGEEIFEKILDESFLSHPAFHCDYDTYIEYVKLREGAILHAKEFKQKMELPYT